jgi:hypothetical protein
MKERPKGSFIRLDKRIIYFLRKGRVSGHHITHWINIQASACEPINGKHKYDTETYTDVLDISSANGRQKASAHPRAEQLEQAMASERG